MEILEIHASGTMLITEKLNLNPGLDWTRSKLSAENHIQVVINSEDLKLPSSEKYGYPNTVVALALTPSLSGYTFSWKEKNTSNQGCPQCQMYNPEPAVCY